MRKFYSRILLVLALMLTTFLTKAQVANYVFTAASGTYTEVSGGTAVPIVGDAIISATLPIGFTFNYEGTNYTQFRASSDGFLSFNTAATNTATNSLATSVVGRRPLVAPLWDDLNATTGTGVASYQTTGAVGSRVFTMEWRNWRWNWSATGVTISFQVKLYEGTNVIEFVYRQESGAVNSASASIGLAGATLNNFLSLNSTGTNPVASSTVETTTLNTKPATGQVYIFTPSTCVPVSGLGATAVTTTSATIGWTAPTSGTFEYQINTTGTGAVGAGTAITNGTNLTGLTPNTNYTVLVRVNCGAGSFSAWVPVSFNTPCVSSSIPYFEGFEAITAAGTLPPCMTATSFTTLTNTGISAQSNNRSARTGTDYGYYSWNPGAAGQWFFTAPLSVTAGTTYRFSVWYKTDGATGFDAIRAYYGNSNTAAAQTNLIVQQANPTNTGFLELTGLFTPTTTGSINVGIQVTGTSSTPWYVTIDDIEITAPLFTDIKINSVTATGVVCPGTSASVSAVILNNGLNPINFATNPLTLTGVLTGGGTATATVNTGTLAPGATQTVNLTPALVVSAGGNYTITVTSSITGDGDATNNSASFTGSTASTPVDLTITPSAAAICAGDAAVALAASGGISAQMATANSGTISVAVPDASVAGVSTTLTLNGIPSGAVIDSMVVTLNMTHTFVGDMYFNLQGPNGQVINLITEQGGNGDNFVNTRITSNASAPSLSTGTAPFTGTFRADFEDLITVPPTTSFTFSSVWGTPNGTYTLYMYDPYTGDAGTLTNWSITAYYKGVAYVWTPTTGLFLDAAATIPYTGGSLATVYAKPSSTQTYSITATSGAGCSATATSTVTVNTLPAITSQPTSASVCSGSNVTFTVGATGSGLTYQWQKDGVDISGANAASYTIASVISANAGNYTVVVSGTCPPSLTSSVAVLSVDAAPIITTQPVSQNICPGAPVTFSVVASGASLTYQWRKAGVNISGATSSSYTIAAVSAADAASYDVVVTSTACGTFSTTSNAATLALNSVPAITVQPVAVANACFGSSATFSVTATGTGLTYQWQKDGVNIPGATGATYTVSASAATIGSYRVIVSGTCSPSVTSNSVTLATTTVNAWRGTVSTAWNTAANWCSGVPTSTTDVTIPSGTPFAPLVSATSEARSVTVNSGATLTIDGTGTLSLYGNIVNNGTLATSAGTLAFRGAANQAVPALTLANVIMNGAGGATISGNMAISNSLTLTLGNITIGSNNLQLPQVNTVITNPTGSVASHIITNGSGTVKSNSITSYSVIFPVGFDAASYNPVTINNGDAKDYSVRVTNGINPGIMDPTRAINRTWIITPSSAPSTPATILFQYADAHANTVAVPTAAMEVGVFANPNWVITSPDGGVLPGGSSIARTVATQTTQFGSFVIANTGSIDVVGGDDITTIALMPNQITHNSMLRVVTRRATRVDWTIADASGRVIRRFTTQLTPGQNDIPMNVSTLANGTYMLSGYSEGYNTQLIRFIKL